MQDSVLVVALNEAKSEAASLCDLRAVDLRRRIAAAERAVDGATTRRSKPEMIRLALHALALRDEAMNLRAERFTVNGALDEMMD